MTQTDKNCILFGLLYYLHPVSKAAFTQMSAIRIFNLVNKIFKKPLCVQNLLFKERIFFVAYTFKWNNFKPGTTLRSGEIVTAPLVIAS